MTKNERACQIWAVLAWAARNRQIITYGLLGKLIGVPTAAIGAFLEPIQSYCLIKKLPPLTILVVQQESGIPGGGFSGSSPGEYAREHMRVFEYDWLEHGNPQAEKLEEAVKAMPSKG